MDVINGFLNHLKSRGYAANTIRTYKSALAPFTDRDLNLITAADMMIILSRYNDPAAATSRLSAFNTFFKWAVEQGLAKNNPAERVGTIHVEKYLPAPIPENDLKEIFEFINTMPLPDQTYFYLIRFLAIKPTEALLLRTQDVSWVDQAVTIENPQYKRYIPFAAGDDKLFTLLRKLCLQREGPLFISKRQQRASYYWAYRRWKRVMNNTGLDYTIEQLRQVRIIEWINDGIPRKTISRWAGGLNSMFDYYMEG